MGHMTNVEVFERLARMAYRYQVSDLHFSILYSSRQLICLLLQHLFPTSTEHNCNITALHSNCVGSLNMRVTNALS